MLQIYSDHWLVFNPKFKVWTVNYDLSFGRIRDIYDDVYRRRICVIRHDNMKPYLSLVQPGGDLVPFAFITGGELVPMDSYCGHPIDTTSVIYDRFDELFNIDLVKTDLFLRRLVNDNMITIVTAADDIGEPFTQRLWFDKTSYSFYTTVLDGFIRKFIVDATTFNKMRNEPATEVSIEFCSDGDEYVRGGSYDLLIDYIKHFINGEEEKYVTLNTLLSTINTMKTSASIKMVLLWTAVKLDFIDINVLVYSVPESGYEFHVIDNGTGLILKVDRKEDTFEPITSKDYRLPENVVQLDSPMDILSPYDYTTALSFLPTVLSKANEELKDDDK